MQDVHVQAFGLSGRNTPDLDELAFVAANDGQWMQDAACRKLDGDEADRIFFPGRGHDASEARAICATCPVQNECLEYAIKNVLCGVWGGTVDRERRQPGRRHGRFVSDGTLGTIVELRERGLSYDKIAKYLQDRGIPTPRGGRRWHQQSVRNIAIFAPKADKQSA